MLIGKEPQSDLTPVKQEADHLDLTMKQPTDIVMFYSLRDSRT
ncbi:hypothetical protein H336_22440 [Vibrio parahaemolyticus EN9701072]|nr:hypothetical protein H331_23545 [Vibrio parahaemolyticus 3644]KIT55755.1 hypothetical protein H336_22440 [Vibrio parahaemolyticus EN9701072]